MRETGGGRPHRRGAVADHPQFALDARAERQDRVIDRGAALLLLGQGLALLFGRQPFGDVLMSAYPMATPSNRAIDDQNGAPVGGLDDCAVRFSMRERAQRFDAIFLRIAANAASREAVADDINELAAGFYDRLRQAIHFQIAAVAQNQLA